MSEPRRHPKVINLSEVEGRTNQQGTKFGATVKLLGFNTGAARQGCSWHEVPPGRAAWPRHFHCVNEEAMFVLEGEGMLRVGEDEVAIRAGDYANFPIGPDFAHLVRNTGQGPLRYLGLSTLSTGEVVGYPDSKKFGASGAPSTPAAMRGEFWVRALAKDGESLGYYDGEDVG
jgi:uncharacterized cupin superfamily protein